MTDTQRNELLNIQKRAKSIPYYEQKHLSEKEVTLLIIRLLPETKCIVLPEILKSDLSIMSHSAAVAGWCDPEYGLGRSYPGEIIKISQEVLSYAASY